jgi:hypothetical protein
MYAISLKSETKAYHGTRSVNVTSVPCALI